MTNKRTRILFFGAAADAAGTRETEVEVANGSTVGELVESLKAKHPGLADRMPKRLYASASSPIVGAIK